ncbi:MAG: hypothetical protein R6W88_02290 [Desulfobacterales bacterium]
MKRHFMAFSRHYTALMILLLLAMLSLIFPIPSSAGNESKAGDELISLKVKDEPLGNVLNKISVATGYDISLDDKWRNYRVTASLEEVSLHEGLKRILRNLNSAIIYVSSKKIQIIIYDKTASEDTSYAPPAGQPPDRTPPSQRPSSRPLRQRQPLPTPQAIEKENRTKPDEEPTDNAVVSDQESETGTPDSEGEEITKPESFEPDPNERTDKDLEDKSSP